MIDTIQKSLVGQYEGALSMMRQCALACPPEHWEGKIANYSFRIVIYHTLFFVDFYLSTSEDDFALRDLHQIGGDDRVGVTPGLPKDLTLQYLEMCREKVLAVIPAETAEILEGPSGFSWRTFSRLEMHVYNIRHIQHHTGQLSAYLRRIGVVTEERGLPWEGTGWK